MNPERRPPDLDDEFLTVAEVAAILKLNQQPTRNWISQGSLAALHVVGRSPAIPALSYQCAYWDQYGHQTAFMSYTAAENDGLHWPRRDGENSSQRRSGASSDHRSYAS
jgi:hypothetical protein